VRRQLPTEVEFLSGAIAREAERAGVAAPLHSTIYRLIKAREAGWTYQDENQPALSHKQHGDDAEDRNNNGRQEDRSNRERIKA
jgi:hypothetical protein